MKLLMLTIFLFQTLDKLSINAETPVLSDARCDGDPHVSPKRKFLVQAILPFTVRKGGTTMAANVSTTVCTGMKSLLR